MAHPSDFRRVIVCFAASENLAICCDVISNHSRLGGIFVSNWHIPRFNLNLADDTIRDKDFGGQVRDQLKETKIPPNRLWFEMTSQQMARFSDAAKQTITRLKSLGCAIAVSDFSSAEMIAKGYKDAGAQIVKLSGSVVRNIHRSPEALPKVLELNGWCHKLGLQTVVEFVEHADTLPMLRKVGVDFAQGFGIAEPGPLSLVDGRLHETSTTAAHARRSPPRLLARLRPPRRRPVDNHAHL